MGGKKKMNKPKAKSHPSNLQLVCDKEVEIVLERIMDSVATANRSALQPQEVTQSSDNALIIDSMPNEILLMIFGYLSHNELGQIARVCRTWNKLTRSPALWKKVEVQFHYSHVSQHIVAECFINKLQSSVTHLSLHFKFRSNWTEPLDFEKLSKKLKAQCPHLKMLILESVKFLNSILFVIDLCTMNLETVKTLAIRYSEFPECSVKKEYRTRIISKIEILDIYCCFEFGFDNKPPFSRMPYLKELHIRHMIEDYIDDSWFRDDASSLNQLHILDLMGTDISPRIFQTIQDNGLNLKELYLCGTHLEDSYLNFNKSVFPHLQTICFSGCNRVTCEGVISLIRFCPSLQKVYANEEVAKSYVAHPFVAANKCKLQIVKAHQCFACHKFQDTFFDLIYFPV